MTTLYIHAGHRKTGSSHIQSSLEVSRANLLDVGIKYPRSANSAKAAQGMITGGNTGPFFRSQSFPALPEGTSTLFSSESLFRKLAGGDVDDRLSELARSIGADRIKILLFIRDPIKHASSCYQQSIKRNGNTGTIEDWYRTDYADPSFAADVIDRFGHRTDVELTVWNYSVCKHRLLERVAEWLDVPTGTLVPPPSTNVNRSMTRGELEFQRVLNAKLGRSGRIFSDSLCNRLPEVAADTIYPDVELQQNLLDRLAGAFRRVNEFVADDHKYRLDLQPESTDDAGDSRTLGENQIAVIAESLGDEIKLLRESISATEIADSVTSIDTKLSTHSHQMTSMDRKIDVVARRLSKVERQVRPAISSPGMKVRRRAAKLIRRLGR